MKGPDHKTSLTISDFKKKSVIELIIAHNEGNYFANNKILKHNGTNWIISDLVTSTLTGLTDTTLTAPSNGEVLKYNGSAWVNAADTDTDFDGDLKATTLTSSTGDINVATYTDRNVILDLNGKTISQSIQDFCVQRFFALIQLGLISTPYTLHLLPK